MIFLTIVLIIYTFATVYYVNGLLEKADPAGDFLSTSVINVSFEDSMYYSGLIFTTLGSSEIIPIGIGQGVTLFESVTGYLVLGFLTAIFIQAIITGREK
ncbi:MAG: ion channel [Methanomassiliicoccales archaeon]|nr:ion channel [Methanomassiliicoccales archaeon]